MGLNYFYQLTLSKPGGADYSHHINYYYWHPGVLDLTTALHKYLLMLIYREAGTGGPGGGRHWPPRYLAAPDSNQGVEGRFGPPFTTGIPNFFHLPASMIAMYNCI